MAENRVRSVAEAVSLVLREASQRSVSLESVPLSEALGRVLAEEVRADLDLPPFDKALVDGFAVRSADLGENGGTLRVVGEVFAGSTFDGVVQAGEAVSIMTGAPMPEGADAVVMVEKTTVADGLVTIPTPAKPGQNRLLRAAEFRLGDLLLRPGTILNPPRLGVAASVGTAHVMVARRPSVALVGTGDEIVPIDAKPAAGQIRDSNSTTLGALCRRLGAGEILTRTVPDEFDRLVETFAELTGSNGTAKPRDFILISGGVSAGKKDLVPAALATAGVRQVFHKVELKPGKPLWFGVGPARGEHPGTLVYGLPGNPVSGLVCGLLFVAPAVRAITGVPTSGPLIERRLLAVDHEYRQDRPAFHPARLRADGTVEPLPWAGSADLKTAGDGDGFVSLEPGEHALKAGTIVGFLPIP